MKRRELTEYLKRYGCELLREGAKHSWWHNPLLQKKSAIPRHTELSDILANKICKDLGVPPVK